MSSTAWQRGGLPVPAAPLQGATPLAAPLQSATRPLPTSRQQPHNRRAATAAAAGRPWKRLLSAGWDTAQEAAGGVVARIGSSAAGAEMPAGTSSAPHPVDEVYENQRYFGILWKAPLSVLDWPEWSDTQGNPVALALSPAEDPGSWEAVTGPATDAQGWQYATVFKHLEYKRAGGRSSSRFGDMVRRRLWRRRPGVTPETAPAVAVPTEPAGVAAATGVAAAAAEAAEEGGSGSAMRGDAGAAMAAAEASRATREAEAKRQAIKSFVGMVMDLLSRRQVWDLVPWDPSALFVLPSKHQQVYQELQAQAYERRLFTADEPAPPSQLREGRTLLQDLICAAMHSRAAYGFPAAAGMMGTVADYIKLQTIQPLTFDAVGGVSAEANNESVAALAGIAPEDILMAEWRNSPYRPCHYVAIDRANQVVVVSIRGSLQVGDLLSDLAAAPMEVDIAGADGWVHQGIFAAATFIHCNTTEALQEAARRCPGWPVLITGHSLGGGTAALLTLLLQEAGLPEGLGPLRGITIGTAAVMSRPLAERCNDLVTSVILGSDVIPHLSYASVEALLLEASEASPVRRTVQGWGNKLAGALNKSAAKQQELSQSAAAALTDARIVGTGAWATVRNASLLASRSASSKGLSKIASLVSEVTATATGALQPQLQQQLPARQIPILEQRQPAARPGQPEQQQQRQKQQQQQPRQVPVIDLSQTPLPPPQQQQQQQPGLVPERAQQAPAAPAGTASGTAAAGAGQEVLPAAADVAVAGLEGDFFVEPVTELAAGAAAGAAGTAGAGGDSMQIDEPAAQQWQQQQQQEPDILFPGFEADLPLADTAMAAAAVAEEGRQAGGAVAVSDVGPGNPELLYPPGRIIWIFPADEQMLPAEAENQLTAMDAAWQGAGGAPDSEEEEGSRQQQQTGQQQRSVRARTEQQQQQQQGEQQQEEGRQSTGRSRDWFELTNADAAVQGPGAVSLGEAMHAVETGETGQHSAAAAAAGASGAAAAGQGAAGVPGSAGNGQRSVPVVVDADRSSFERLLLMPDMLNDHLPDRIVAALQQL